MPILISLRHNTAAFKSVLDSHITPARLREHIKRFFMLTQETTPEAQAEMAASVAERDRHFRWNFSMMGIDIAFFTLGVNISSAYVVLPLFVHHLSSSNIAAALVPAV